LQNKMNSLSDILKTFATKAKKLAWNFGLHAFWVILFIVFIEIIWAGFIFYQYVILAQDSQPQATGDIIKFNDKVYQSVLKESEERQQAK